MSGSGRARMAVVAMLLGVGGFFVMGLWSQVIGATLSAAGLAVDPGTAVGELVGPVATIAGAASVAGYYLWLSGRGSGFLDVRLPDRRGAIHAVAGTLAIVLLGIGSEVVVEFFGIPTASHATAETARTGDPTFLLVLIPAAFLFVAPGEELLYRNLVQKLLAESFPAWRAIILASAVFALVHVGALAAGDTTSGLAVSLAVAFALSLVLGVVYHRTHNVVVPAFVHGCYNAVVFGTLYLQYA